MLLEQHGSSGGSMQVVIKSCCITVVFSKRHAHDLFRKTMERMPASFVFLLLSSVRPLSPNHPPPSPSTQTYHDLLFSTYSGDREKKYTQVFESAKLDGTKMNSLNGRGVEIAVRNATQGEAWVDDLVKVLKDMMDPASANDTNFEESAEMKKMRDKMVQLARDDNPEGRPHNPKGGGSGGSGGGGGGRGGGGWSGGGGVGGGGGNGRGKPKVVLVLFCPNELAEEVVSRAQIRITEPEVMIKYPLAFPINNRVCRSKHIYPDRFPEGEKTYGKVDALVQIPFTVLFMEHAEVIIDVLPNNGPADGNMGNNARLRSDLDARVDPEKKWPWKLNRDFVDHVLPFLGLPCDASPDSLLSIIEHQAPPKYKHKTLEGWFCYGDVKVEKDRHAHQEKNGDLEEEQDDDLEEEIHAARREGLEQTGILLPDSVFNDLRNGITTNVLGTLSPRRVLKSEHNNTLTVLAVELPRNARAEPAVFPANPDGNGFEEDNLKLSKGWAERKYVRIVI